MTHHFREDLSGRDCQLGRRVVVVVRVTAASFFYSGGVVEFAEPNREVWAVKKNWSRGNAAANSRRRVSGKVGGD